MTGSNESIRELIGRTPIVRLRALGGAGLTHQLHAKCEFMNPGGSVKDRIGFYLVEQAERTGRLRPGGTIVEATAGNTGVALAMAAAQKGYRLVTVMTTKMSAEKIDLMRQFGAEVHVVPYGLAPDDPDAFINYARRLADTISGAWYVDQFNNPDNFQAHYRGTGPEIWEQTNGEVDVLVAGVGTGGTLSGSGAFLKERKPSIRLVMADPKGSILKRTIEGEESPAAKPYLIEGIGGDFVPGNAGLDQIDVAYEIPDSEAVATALRTLRSEGLFVGGSAGCILAAALRFCREWPGSGLNVLAILPDGGRSYMSTIYNPEWREKHGFGHLNQFSTAREAAVCT